MNNDFVPYELAVKLKEKGFREECLYSFNYLNEIVANKLYNDEDFVTTEDLYHCVNFGDRVDAPTISQVLKWLRKKKDIYVQVEYINNKCFGSVIIRRTTGGVIVSYKDDKFHYSDSETLSHEEYEQAALAGIEYVIDNLI